MSISNIKTTCCDACANTTDVIRRVKAIQRGGFTTYHIQKHIGCGKGWENEPSRPLHTRKEADEELTRRQS